MPFSSMDDCRWSLVASHIMYYTFTYLLQSPVDGKPMLLTPEESIQIQVSSLVFVVYVHAAIMVIVHRVASLPILAQDVVLCFSGED